MTTNRPNMRDAEPSATLRRRRSAEIQRFYDTHAGCKGSRLFRLLRIIKRIRTQHDPR